MQRGGEGRGVPPQSGLQGRRAPPDDPLPILQSDWLYRPPVPSSALPASWSETGQLGPFLLQNTNDFPLSPRAGNRHQLAQPTQTAGCQPACPPPTSPPTTWEEAIPQAGAGYPALSRLQTADGLRLPAPAVPGGEDMGSRIRVSAQMGLLHQPR